MDGMDDAGGDLLRLHRHTPDRYDRLGNSRGRGFLPLVTTRGDRLFIGLLAAAYVNLAWAGFTDLTQWYGAVMGAIVVIVVMRWG
jgi:predicted small integral membrane protein